MPTILVTATSFLDELQTHPPGEGEPRRRLEAAAQAAGYRVEYRCDRDPRSPMTADELRDVAAVIADLEEYPAETLAAVGPTGETVTSTSPSSSSSPPAGAALRLISRYGIGTDAVDLAAARAAGIDVCNAPGANARPTAEWTLATIIDIAGRRILQHERAAAGLRKEGPSRIDLTGATVGIVGTGHVGMLMAELLAPFGVKILAKDRGDEREWISTYDVEMVDLSELCRRASVVTLHASAREQVIGPAELDLMGPTTILVNCARGYHVDNRAAWERVRDGRIWGYGIDEVWPEPDLPLAGLNIAASPHVGSDSDRGKLAMQEMSVGRVLELLENRPLSHVVNS